MYSADPFVTQCRAIDKKPPYDPNNPADQNRRTEEEEKNLVGFKRNVFIGFIIAGYWLPDRTPFGFEVPFDPMSASAPTPQRIPIGNYYYAGAPNIIKRLINGTDEGLKDSIMSAGKWTGTDSDLMALLNQFIFLHPNLPIRDAIDFVHFVFTAQLKLLKP